MAEGVLQIKVMKLYQSPLFITATLFVLYGIYLMADLGRGTMGWGYLAGVIILVVGLVAVFIHFILKAFVKNKRTHFITEFGIVLLFFIWLLLNS
jgi:hypothetical protein